MGSLSVRLEVGQTTTCGLINIETLVEMTYVFVIVIKNIKNVVVGMDNPQGIRGWPPFIPGITGMFFSSYSLPYLVPTTKNLWEKYERR